MVYSEHKMSMARPDNISPCPEIFYSEIIFKLLLY